MKNIMKACLVIALFSAAAFADGDMTGGGKSCPQGQTCLTGDMTGGGKTCPQGQTCLTGDMTGGGKTCPQGQTCLVNGDSSNESTDKDSADSIFDIISAYLDSIF